MSVKPKEITDQMLKSIGTLPEILVIQSSFKGIGEVDGGMHALIRGLIDAFGTQSTLIMPAYNFESWTKEAYFSVNDTPSKVGALTEEFRKTKGVRRTDHPIHSHSVIGPLQKELCELRHVDSFGEDSIYVKLLEKNAVYCTLGIGLEQPFLPCHLPETRLKVAYRMPKSFKGKYVDENGVISERTYSFNVRVRDMKQTPVYPAHVMQYEMGAVKNGSFNGIKFYFSTARDYDASMVEIINKNPSMFS